MVLNDPEALADDVFMVRDGVLVCTGAVQGWLETIQAFTNYELTVEWRWPEKPGNSGVLVHVGELDSELGWPKSIEAQLASGQAGDLWEIGRSVLVQDEVTRRQPKQLGDLHSHRRIPRLEGVSERPIGQWNTMVVRCVSDRITVTVNGALANEGSDTSALRGRIALQSEGAPVEFRRVQLVPVSL